jgi:ectoine hydroxylase-related dioxygenase (phytanoyl-CoA dioxygenase family)
MENNFNIPATLTAGGKQLDLSPEKFGLLRESNDIATNATALQDRFNEDGYVFIKGFFDREKIVSVRQSIADRLNEEGLLDPNFPVIDCIAQKNKDSYFRPDISNANDLLKSVIYSPSVLSFFSGLLGGEALHYDFTWLRVVSPGLGSNAHCDIVYMGRGTHNIRTMWVPYGDVPLSVGGLLLLENSHKIQEIKDGYCKLDVDTSCENQPGKNVLEANGFESTGAIDNDFLALQNRFGGRWLTASYEMGDMLLFGMNTIHGSLDNGSSQIRISSDSRYQLASEPTDPRWVGPHHTGHGKEARRELIC